MRCGILLAMDIREENVIKVNNSPTTDWASVNNLATSDEKDPKNQDSEYAKKNRGRKALSISIFAISGVSILTGGSLLSAIVTEPTLSNIEITDSDISISISLTIKNPQGLEVTSSLYEDDVLKEKTDMSFKGTNDFAYTYGNVDYSKKNVIKISFDNHLDYSKILYEKEIIHNTVNSLYLGGNLYV